MEKQDQQAVNDRHKENIALRKRKEIETRLVNLLQAGKNSINESGLQSKQKEQLSSKLQEVLLLRQKVSLNLIVLSEEMTETKNRLRQMMKERNNR